MSNRNSIHNTSSSNSTPGQKSLRSACDLCHQGKVKCAGGTPCDGCRGLGVECTYSTSNRTGRPKGVKNKKTLERIKQMRAASANETDQRSSDSASSAQASAQASPVRSSSLDGVDYRPSFTSTNLGQNPASQVGGNGMGMENVPIPSWNFWPPADFTQFQSKADPNFGLQRTHTHETTSSPTSSSNSGFNAMDISNDKVSDLAWIDSLLNTSNPAYPRTDGMEQPQEPTYLSNQQQPYAAHFHSSNHMQSHPQAPLSPACNCVSQLTSQLTSMKALGRSENNLRPDIILTIARDAQSTWETHMQCSSCRHSDDKDVLVLSVMALRALLNLIQKAGGQQGGPSLPGQNYSEMSSNDIPSSPRLNVDHSFLGSYQLVNEERRMVVEMLLQRTLKDLNRTIEHLKQKSMSVAGSTPSRGSMSNSSSRSSSNFSTLPSSSASCQDILADMTLPGGMADLEAKDGMSLDEHDSYLHGSLQNSTATIESLLGNSRPATMFG